MECNNRPSHRQLLCHHFLPFHSSTFQSLLFPHLILLPLFPLRSFKKIWSRHQTSQIWLANGNPMNWIVFMMIQRITHENCSSLLSCCLHSSLSLSLCCLRLTVLVFFHSQFFKPILYLFHALIPVHWFTILLTFFSPTFCYYRDALNWVPASVLVGQMKRVLPSSK